MSILCSMVGASFTVAAAAEIIRYKKGIVAIGNAQIDTAQSKFGGSSYLGDGTGDRLYIDGTVLDAQYTVEYWIRASSFSNAPTIVDFRGGGGGAANYSDYITSGGIFRVFINNGDRISSTTTLSTGVWYHIAVVRDSASDIKLYVNGTKEGSTYNSSSYHSNTTWYIGDNYVFGNSFNGHIDEIRISNTARYTSNFTAPTAAFVNDNNTVLLLHCNGTDASTFFEDDNGLIPFSTRTAKTVTANGNAQVDTAQYKFGSSSSLLDGTGDFLKLGSVDSTDLVFSGDFTFEGWFRFNSTTGTQGIFSDRIGGYGTAANGYKNFYLEKNTSNGFFWGVSGAGDITDTGTSLVTTNTWYHIAVVRSGSTIKFYLDGIQKGSNYTYSSPIGSGVFYIGAIEYSAGNYYSVNGWMDEVRISNTARYTANFTAPTAPFNSDANTLLLLHMEGTDAATTFTDDVYGVRSQKGIVAIGNAQIDTAQSKFGGASALFDGTGDYLFSPSNSDFGFGTGDFTLEGWFRFVNFTNGPALFDLRSAGGTEVKPLIYCGSDGTLYYYVNGAARITGSALSTATWYHITVSRSGTSTKMFVNGSQVGSTYTDSNNYGTTVVSIGIASWNTSFNALNGHADEIRISNTARYTANFTPSTTPFVNDSNTVLLMHMDGTDATTVFRDDNGARAPKGIAAQGNAQIDTAQSKFGGASALFDGTGDYLIIGNDVDSDMALTGTTWTVEYWARINAHAGSYQGTVGIWDPAGGTGSVWYVTTNAYNGTNKMGISYFYGTNSGSGDLSFGSALSTGVWQHHAFVRNGNTLTAYLDGVSQGTHDMTGRTIDITGYNSSSNTTLKLTVGALTGANGAFNGWLDEIRISNIARYTAGFTAPTSPFSNDTNTVLLIHADGTDGSTVFTDDNGQVPQTP